MQEDLTSLVQWETDWQMKFNVAKCHSMRVTRHQYYKQILFDYSLHNQNLENVCKIPQLLIAWIGVSMSQKSLSKELRHLVSFAGTWLMHSAQYRRNQTYSDALKHSFSPQTIPHWNSLSPSVANVQSTEEF